MKKTGVLLLMFLLLSMFSVVLAYAEDTPPIPDLPGTSGGINPETGLPHEFDKFQEMGSKLSKEEQGKAYLRRDWTKLLAENEILSRFLFYTDKVFSVFNPVWKVIFGLEFSWSWAFIFSFGIWITLIVLIYSPVKSFLDLNIFLILAASIIISSLAGIAGAISHLVDLLIVMLTNPWYVWAAIIGLVLFCVIYYMVIKKYGEKFKEKAAKEQTKMDREAIHADANVARKTFEKAKERLKGSS